MAVTNINRSLEPLIGAKEAAEPLIGAKEAAKFVGKSPLTVTRWARDGKLPSYAYPPGKRGKVQRAYRLSELEAFVNSLRCGWPLQSLETESREKLA